MPLGTGFEVGITMREYRIGIDPGVSGALALIEYKGKSPTLFEVADMPVMALGAKHRKQVNAAELAKVLTSWHFEGAVVYLEKVQSMPGQGVAGVFSFGMSFGIVQGVVAALGLPMVLVTPQQWKKRARLLHTQKDQARTFAQQLFPQADLGRVKDIGRADAILIAMYGKE